MFYERQRAGRITGVIKNHNYEGANDRRKQFYRGSTLPEILHTGWPVGNSPTSIKVLRFPPIYMGLGRYLPAILYTRLQDRTEALLEESDRRARDKGIRREELMRLCRILTSYVGFSTTTLCTGSII